MPEMVSSRPLPYWSPCWPSRAAGALFEQKKIANLSPHQVVRVAPVHGLLS